MRLCRCLLDRPSGTHPRVQNVVNVMRLVAVPLALIAGWASACTSSAPGKPHPSTIAPPPHSLITAASNQKTVTMYLGQSATMYLRGYWTDVKVTQPAVLRLGDVAGGYPLSGYRATITAQQLARSRVTAHTDDPCFHRRNYGCGLPVLNFVVTVRVVR
jgi:hypothetical protein